ncbi:MAG: Y-family DNA polymerase [Chlamydiae bacterium]|nr:Y-family DNA polymerase [Chlamydiota bacterium]
MLSTKPSHLYFLVDCNQFFVSCELAFRPDLLNTPTVVLSNNDGCVVARSKEAKQIGIPMGVPLYQIETIIHRHNVNIFSSNFELYGDMSFRVMQTLAMFSPDIEEYSIDEAFLKIQTDNPLKIAQEIKQKVFQNTGIPVSVGVGPTKTLSKLANDIAKKTTEGCSLIDPLQAHSFRKVAVGEIWGIGKKIAAQLESFHIRTAFDLLQADETFIKKKFSVILLRTVLELKGIECLTFDEIPSPKQSITSSKSFGKPVYALSELEEAICTYTAKAGMKLRKDHSFVKQICVFISTSRFQDDLYYNYQIINLPQETDYIPHLMQYAKKALSKIFIEGVAYKKAGVSLLDLSRKKCLQPDFFSPPILTNEKQEKAMKVLEQIKGKMGKQSIYFASEGIEKSWLAKKELCSNRYTTRWNELLTIHI